MPNGNGVHNHSKHYGEKSSLMKQAQQAYTMNDVEASRCALRVVLAYPDAHGGGSEGWVTDWDCGPGRLPLADSSITRRWRSRTTTSSMTRRATTSSP